MNHRCPHCKSRKIKKSGIEVTVSKGQRQRYKCNSCGRTHTRDMEVNGPTLAKLPNRNG